MAGHVAAQLIEARRLARLGRHQRAAGLFARAARAGSAAACLELGRAYLLGLGLPCCPGAAFGWLTRAAEAGEIDAQLMLASLALQGQIEPAPDGLFETAGHQDGQPADFRLALHWARQAAEGGSAEALALLGYIFTAGPGELRDSKQAELCYQQAARAGCPHGQLGWSVTLLRRGLAEDAPEVRALLHSAARSDVPAAHCVLGIIEEQGIGGRRDLAAAAQHYRRGAELGHGASQLRYGIALLHGHGVEPDPFRAESWLRRATIGGEPSAAATLGDLYASPGDLPPNHAEAMIWFRHAAENGHGGAARALAQLYLHGRGVGVDRQEAICWLRIAVARGDLQARDDLAALLLSPAVTEADQVCVLAWLRQRAARGDAAAAFNVGLCCAEGIGTRRDDGEAMAWFRLAADELALAQFWCGRMLAEGRGARCDLVAARSWFLLAAEQGMEDAAVAAGEMLANGRGGAADPAAARALFTRAAACGHAAALFALAMLASGACGEPEDPSSATQYLRCAADRGHPRARLMLEAAA